MPRNKFSVLLFAFFVMPSFLYAQFGSEQDSTKKVKIAAIPMINYNNSLGVIVGGMGSMFYKLNVKDTISPSSVSMLMGIYTGNNSYMGLGVQKFYFKEDQWRAKILVGTGDYFFQFFQGLPGIVSGQFQDEGVWIDFDTRFTFFLGELQRQVVDNFYVGVEAVLMHAKTNYESEILPDSYADMNSLGYTLQFDNRDDVNFPVKGWFANFKNRFIRDWIGSSSNYDNFEIYATNFWDIKQNSKSILVSRIYANIATGDVPFQGQNYIGGDDLRGYSKGEYRGEQIYAIQAELRQNVYKKFGMIGFIGLGSAVDRIGDIPDQDLLPSIGFGLRYLMIPKEKVNIGIDVGVGKDDWSLTFRIGEAFSR